MKKRFSRGFTLIELLVVIGIIGVLATIVIVYLSHARDDARDKRIMSQLSSMRSQAQLYSGSGAPFMGACPTDPANPLGSAAGTLFAEADNGLGKLLPRPIVPDSICYSATGLPSQGAVWSVAWPLSTGGWDCADSNGFSNVANGTGPFDSSTSGSNPAIAPTTKLCSTLGGLAGTSPTGTTTGTGTGTGVLPGPAPLSVITFPIDPTMWGGVWGGGAGQLVSGGPATVGFNYEIISTSLGATQLLSSGTPTSHTVLSGLVSGTIFSTSGSGISVTTCSTVWLQAWATDSTGTVNGSWQNANVHCP